MALAIDGSAGKALNVPGATLVSPTLTTANTNDVLIAVVFTENAVNGSLITTTGVKLTTAGTAFAKLIALTVSSFDELSVWWLASSGTISQTITATLSAGTADGASISVFGVSGANTSSPWDTATGSPYHATASTNVAPSVSGVSTAAANAMLLGFCGVDSGASTGNPVTQTAGAMAGTTGTLINSATGSGGGTTVAEYRILSATIASQSVAFGTTNTSTNPWGVIAAAIVAASGASATTIGWSRPSDSDRLPWSLRPDKSAVESSQFFRPSPNPVPTTWLPTTGEEDRPPPLKRPPDEPRLNTYFIQSPNPVPTIWLPQWEGWERPKRVAADPSATVQVLRTITSVVPISGIAWHNPSEDKERPAPFKPTPGNSFFSVQIPTSAAIWLPTTGQEDRPPNPNRIRTDFAPQWFVRSPNPVPTTWLPQSDGWERPKPVVPDASGEALVFKPVTATVPISGIAWYTPGEDKERPVPYRPTPGNYFFSVQVSTATVPVSGMAWYVTQEQMRPPAPRDQYYVTWLSRPPVAIPNTISGIAWNTPSEDKERPAPYLPTPGNNFFSVQVPISSTVAGIGWLGPSDIRPPPPKDDPYVIQTLPPFIAPPLQSFYAAANADDFNPLPRPKEVEGATTQTFRAFVTPVGIAGIAWWQPVQVFLEPLPSYRDYRPAWDPQFIVQIAPPTPNLFLRPLMGFGL